MGRGESFLADVLAFGILWVLLSGLAEWAVTDWQAHQTYFYPASNTAYLGQDAFNIVLNVAAPVFVFVVLMLIYSMVRFRARRGETGEAPIQTRFHPAFVWTWIVLSFLVNVFLWLHPTTTGLEAFWDSQAQAASEHPLVVDVYARQWEWIFAYPQYHILQAIDPNTGQDVLVLPVDRPVTFVLRSEDPFHPYDSAVDVIHSFWIPAFGVKWDVVPGETRTVTITPTRITSTAVDPHVRVQCAEVCGAGHPYMIADLQIVSSQAFDQWVAWERKHCDESNLGCP